MPNIPEKLSKMTYQICVTKYIREMLNRENHFMVKLDISRHTKNRSSFILSLSESGNFAEIETEYDNDFMNRESGGCFLRR